MDSEQGSFNRKRRRLIVAIVLALIVFLSLPWLFKDPKPPPLVGPKLSEIKYEEIRFNNGRLSLAGLLITPDGNGPFPLAVIIHGSGPSRRENLWYTSVAKHLQQNGIAVLLPDKRGSEKSEGDWTKASLQDLAEDTLAAVSFIKKQKNVDIQGIGVVGMSQGGWIAPIAATRSEDISFVVSMSGAAVTTDEQLMYEEVNNIAGMGTYRFVAKGIAMITTQIIKGKPFWRNLAGFDPIPYWSKVSVPAFAAFGGGDENVPVSDSVIRLGKNAPLVKVKVYPDGGHGITDKKSNRIQSAFLVDLVEFIRSATQLGTP